MTWKVCICAHVNDSFASHTEFADQKSWLKMAAFILKVSNLISSWNLYPVFPFGNQSWILTSFLAGVFKNQFLVTWLKLWREQLSSSVKILI